MRKFLIRNFVLGTWVVFAGVRFHTLRAPRILFPSLVAVALIVMGSDPYDYTLYWYDWALVVSWLVMADFGFSFFPFSYFKRRPVKIYELDREQRYDYLRAIYLGEVPNYVVGAPRFGLTDEQFEELRILKTYIDSKYRGKWHLKNLIPLALSIIAIIIYVWVINLIN
jgi:hypothetical protein